MKTGSLVLPGFPLCPCIVYTIGRAPSDWVDFIATREVSPIGLLRMFVDLCIVED